MRFALISLPLLALAACQTTQRDSDQARADGPTCIADQLQDHVGQPISALDHNSLPQPMRVIGPGTAVTMDYRIERLNIEHDQSEIIQRIYCG